MPLSRWERKARLRHGSQRSVAKRFGRPESWVSLVMSGDKRDEVVEKDLARRMRPLTTHEEAFGPLPEKKSETPRVSAVA